MATTVAIKFSPTLKDPKWPKLTAKAGEELELAATPANVTTQTACFEIRNKAGNIVALLDVDSSCKKKWIPLATPKDEEYVFHALLRDKPSAANGYLAVVSRTESINKLTVKATTITDLALDKCFVPKLEKLVAKFKIGGELPAKGRIEIWGERYPTGKPLYAADFVPAAENTWKWDGKKNDAAVIAKVGEYISPQFSPYRLRIIVGQDDDAVKEPYLKGLGKATVADQQFEIIVQKVQIRVQAGYADAGDAKYHLRKALAIEKTPGTPQANGSFAAMGRLPKENESGRIRIPLVSHWGTNQLFDQAGNQATGDNLRVGMGYVVTRTKYAIDSALHTRPEIPVEFEARLRSRKHAAAPTSPSSLLGRFEPEALGPLRMEPFAEDYPSPVERAHGNELDDIYAAASVNNTYFKHAVLKIKQANHSAPNPTGNPVNDGARPVFSFWNARFVVAADDDVTFDFVTRDPGFSYATGSNELTVYLDRTKLTLGTDDQMTKKYKDYKEESATAIKLRTGLTKRGDILWVARNVAAPVVGGVVLRWNNYPLGTNSHEFYGGIRGAKPNNLFLADYSPVPGGSREPIPTLAVTGATNAAPIKVTTGAVHGLATGQEVVIKDVTGNLDANGTFKVTKVSDTEVTLDESDGIDADAFSAGGTLRRTNVTNATPIVITCAADHNLANDDSVYVAAVGGNTAANGVFRVTVVDARNFRLNDSDGSYSDPYTTGGTVQHGGIIDVHRGANLKRYKTIYDGVPGLAAGQITLNGPAEIQKQFAPFDTYRVYLPPACRPAIRRWLRTRFICCRKGGRRARPWLRSRRPSRRTLLRSRTTPQVRLM